MLLHAIALQKLLYKMASESESISKFTFMCGLRGFHVYQEIWRPIVGEILQCCNERNNIHDRYAIATTKRLPGRLANVTVGHLPREISRFTRFLLLRGGVVNVEVIMTQSTEDLLLDRVALKFQ